ncbi:MAG: MAPEG family protein [Parvularculaceae bacterium]
MTDSFSISGAMPLELEMLAAAALWGFIQLVAAAQSANVQYGLKWAASPRDEQTPPLRPVPGRINRNFRNYMETFPFFAVTVLIASALGVHNAFTQWGAVAYLSGRIVYSILYVAGVPLIRSLFWNIAAFGMLAVLAAPFFAPAG